MITSFKAEFRKLRQRPAVWWLGGLILLLVGLVYTFSWIEYNAPTFHPHELTLAQVKATLYPAHFATMIVSGLAVLGGALMLVMGTMVAGSEYAWGTVKTVYAQRPGRLQVLGGQLLAISAVSAVIVASVYALAAACSFVIVNLASAQIFWPAIGDILKAMGATWLIFEAWILFGMAMAQIFRQSALAIGLGLAYMLAVEGILVRFLHGFNLDWLTSVEKFMLGQNANSLANSFQTSGVPAAPTLVSIEHALLVIVAYGVAFIVLAALLVRNRDIA